MLHNSQDRASRKDDTWDSPFPLNSSITYPRLPFITSHTSSIDPKTPARSLTGLPTTPHKACPNSGKKRQATPDLSRVNATPSHRVKMAQIFEEAAAEIRSSTPSRRISAILHGHGVHCLLAAAFAELTITTVMKMGTFPTPLPFYLTPNHQSPDNMAKEPLSSGFTSPAKPRSRSSSGRLILPQSLTPDPQDDDCHSTHGVPLVLPVRGGGKDMVNNYQVDSWLDKVLELSPPHTDHPAFKEFTNQTIGTPSLLVAGGSPWSQTPAKLDRSRDTPCSKLSLSKLVSNKENIPPSTAAKPWSNIASPSAGTIGHQSITPVNPQASDQSSSNFSDSSLGLARPGPTSLSPITRAPHGLLHLSPKRKKAKVAASIKQKQKEPGSSSFTICEDESADVLAELSPVIERHRKGRGPKRGRCPSYYDQDILPQFSPLNDKGAKKDGKEEVKIRKGRKVLRDTKNSAELTKARAFDEAAENAEFEF